MQRVQHREAVKFRHHQVQDDRVRAVVVDVAQRLAPIQQTHRVNADGLQRGPHQVQRHGVVIDHHYLFRLGAPRPEARHRRDDFVGAYRLAQHVGDGEGGGGARLRTHRHAHHGGFAAQAVGPDSLQYPEPALVLQQQAQRDGVVFTVAGLLHRLFTRCRRIDAKPDGRQAGDELGRVVAAVVNHQQSVVCSGRQAAVCDSALRVSTLKVSALNVGALNVSTLNLVCAVHAVQHHMEHAACAQRAAGADASALRYHQAPRQCQAKTRSFINFGGSGVQLLVGREQARQVGRRDADAGVLHFQPQVVVTRCQRAHSDLAALRRELDSVGKVVVEHLLQPLGVQHQRAQ